MAKPPSIQPANLRRTLGPVADLERHLPAEWWKTLFSSLYIKTDGDVVENQLNTTREIDLLLSSTGLRPGSRILDLCCGQGRHSIELANRGYKNLTGVDRSRYLVRLARKRAQQSGLSVSFHERDARKLRFPEDSFDAVILMGNSFGYFDREEDDYQVLEAIKKVLVPDGILALDLVNGDWMRENFERRSWEWIDENHFVCRERSLDRDGIRLVSREVVVHAEMGVIADQFYAERLYSEEKISTLLRKLGFTSTEFHGALQADSDRNQDLGMMANRIFITARAPRCVPRKIRQKVHFEGVTVILGDPTLPDPIKRNGQFNQEDMETIDRLKEALADLPEHKFKYVTNHSNLLSELRSNPPKFVLNLCDEGYLNEATMELHVPALLELLQIPYSGAAPACLATCYNKSFVRSIAFSMDIPVPAETYLSPDDQSAYLPSYFPALVKPNLGDSSIGITKDAVVESPEALIAYRERLRSELPGRPILIQEFLSGEEYSVGLIGNPGLGFHFLPILEVDYSDLQADLPKILGYESKWLADSPYWTQIQYKEAEIDEEERRQLMDYSAALFERLGCRDYARIDFRKDAEGTIKVMEVNPNPGWCWDGKMNIMAGMEGMSYSDLLSLILNSAQERALDEKSRSGE